MGTLALLLGAGALLGLSTVTVKLAAEAGIGPLAFLTWAVIGATAVLSAAARRSGPVIPTDRLTLRYLVLAAAVSVAGPQLIFFSAVPKVGAGFVSLAIALPPLLTYAGALVLRIERFSAWRAAGVALALAGAAAIAIPKLEAAGAEAGWVLATLTGPVLLAIGNLYRTLYWPPGARAETLAPGMLGATALLLLPLGPIAGQSLAVPVATPTGPLLVLLQIGIFAGYYLLFFRLQRRGGPVYLSLLGSVGAVFAVPMAVHLLDERVPAGLALGGPLIAVGIALVTGGAVALERHSAARRGAATGPGEGPPTA